MKNNSRYIVNILILLVAATTALQFTSCNGRRSNEKVNDLIPVVKLVPLLTDVYLADGLIAVPSVQEKHWLKDSTQIYTEVIESHGFTKPQLDRTMKYYFISNPKKLQKIYDAVIANLSDIESKVNILDDAVVTSENLWPGENTYSLPETALTDKVSFDLAIVDTGLYTFTASFRIFPDDQSENPRVTLWFWKPDTSTAGVSVYWPEVTLPKDGVAAVRTVSAHISDPSYTRIRGWLMNHDDKEGQWEKHAQIGTISLTGPDR